jgi:hypothetical protein
VHARKLPDYDGAVAIDIGLWRSTLGDTHPHTGIEIAWDYWPQATHLVWEAPALVACITGGGGGSQQAMFKRDLDPLLAGALARWQQVSRASPQAALDHFFAELQAGFDEPATPDEYQATGVAVLVTDEGAAIANVGLGRGYAWHAARGVLEQLTDDDSLAVKYAAQQIPEWFRETAASVFRKQHPDRDPCRWTVTPTSAEPGRVFVLVSGQVESQLTHAYLTAALEEIHRDPVALAGAQDLADRIGSIAVRFGAAGLKEDRTEWKVHSRLAVAVVWIDD